MRAYNNKKTRGQAMVEFVMYMPLLFALIIFAFEWSQLFVKQMRASTLSREIALAVHRQCLTTNSVGQTVPNDLDTPNNNLICLNQIRDLMLAQQTDTTLGSFPQFSDRGGIVISLYNSDAAKDISTGTNGGYATQYTRSVLLNGSPNLLNDMGTVVVGEVFYNSPSTLPLQSFFDFIMPTTIYKSTIV